MTTPPVKSTTDELIEELEAAARLASPGQWTLTVHTNPVDRFDAQADDWTLSVGGKQVVAAEDGIRNQRDVRYIAAANPANVQTLIARIRELEARTVTLPPPYPMPEPDEAAIDDSHMDPYWAANGMRSAFTSIIKHAGIKVIDPYLTEPPQ